MANRLSRMYKKTPIFIDLGADLVFPALLRKLDRIDAGYKD